MIDNEKIKKIADRDNFWTSIKLFLPRAIYVIATADFSSIDVTIAALFLVAVQKELDVEGEERYNNLTKEDKDYLAEGKNKDGLEMFAKEITLLQTLLSPDTSYEEKDTSLNKIKNLVWGSLYTKKKDIDDLVDNTNHYQSVSSDADGSVLLFRCFIACIIGMLLQEIEIKIIEESN